MFYRVKNIKRLLLLALTISLCFPQRTTAIPVILIPPAAPVVIPAAIFAAAQVGIVTGTFIACVYSFLWEGCAQQPICSEENTQTDDSVRDAFFDEELGVISSRPTAQASLSNDDTCLCGCGCKFTCGCNCGCGCNKTYDEKKEKQLSFFEKLKHRADKKARTKFNMMYRDPETQLWCLEILRTMEAHSIKYLEQLQKVLSGFLMRIFRETQ